MSTLTNFIRDWFPHRLHCVAISIYNHLQYRQRYGEESARWESYYRAHAQDPEPIWREEQLRRLREFLRYVKEHSPFYRQYLNRVDIDHIRSVSDLKDLPLVDKQTLFERLEKVVTVSRKSAIPSKTGGTTGNSLEVLFEKSDFQQRFGFMSYFWGGFGYRITDKAVWLSGKELLSARDIKKERYFKDDYINRIRYISTFHLNRHTFPAYWNALNDYGAQFIFGFPSVLIELCSYAKDAGLCADRPFKVFFSTSEPINEDERALVREVLGCRVIDQYASAEGAPFITECESGNLHIQPLTGVFEVLNEKLEEADEGELVVTSFTTRGTPLIRYRIGDSVVLAPKGYACDCGSTFPVVEALSGRTRDYIYRTDGSKINAVNISNSTKGVSGVIRFQVVQEAPGEVLVKVVCSDAFDDAQAHKFEDNLRERLGCETSIEIHKVRDLPRERSGKFRMLVNRTGQHAAP